MAGIAAETAEHDVTAYLTAYVQEMAFGEEDPGTVMDRYHTPDIEWCTDGVLLDRQRLIDHARPARHNVVSCEVEVHDVVAAGDRFAAWYTLRATMRRGSSTVTEVQMFARLAPDGRVRRVDQLTRTTGSPA